MDTIHHVTIRVQVLASSPEQAARKGLNCITDHWRTLSDPVQYGGTRNLWAGVRVPEVSVLPRGGRLSREVMLEEL